MNENKSKMFDGWEWANGDDGNIEQKYIIYIISTEKTRLVDTKSMFYSI